MHVFEATEASDDELEAEYQEAVAMMTVANSAERKWIEHDSSFGNLSHLKVARPSPTSSSRNSHVLDVGNWASEKR